MLQMARKPHVYENESTLKMMQITHQPTSRPKIIRK